MMGIERPAAAGLILGGCVAVLLVSVLLMPEFDGYAQEVGYMLRVTARVAFCFLILAYIARPLRILTGQGGVLVKNRRYLGLAMALAHTLHFYYVVESLALTDEPLALVTAVFGGLAFVLMWLMAITSNNPSMRLLGRNWKRLHTLGMHYLWLIFMQSFAGRVAGEDPYFIYAGLTLMGVAALLLRLAAALRQRAMRTA